MKYYLLILRKLGTSTNNEFGQIEFLCKAKTNFSNNKL